MVKMKLKKLGRDFRNYYIEKTNVIVEVRRSYIESTVKKKIGKDKQRVFKFAIQSNGSDIYQFDRLSS
jgi:hypothetical protein